MNIYITHTCFKNCYIRFSKLMILLLMSLLLLHVLKSIAGQVVKCILHCLYRFPFLSGSNIASLFISNCTLASSKILWQLLYICIFFWLMLQSSSPWECSILALFCLEKEQFIRVYIMSLYFAYLSQVKYYYFIFFKSAYICTVFLVTSRQLELNWGGIWVCIIMITIMLRNKCIQTAKVRFLCIQNVTKLWN